MDQPEKPVKQRHYGRGRIFRRKYKGTESGSYWIAYYVGGREIRESCHSDRKADAIALLDRRRSEVGVGTLVPMRRVKVASLLDALLADYRDSQKSLDWAEVVDGHLRPFFGYLEADRVGTPALSAYIAKRRENGVGNSTINRELKMLSRAFSIARNERPPKTVNPLPIPRLKEPPARAGFFEDNEFRALRSELPEEVRPVITFGFYTGCRKGEILGLQWHQVDLERGIVRFDPGVTKNDEPREIPLIGELWEMLHMLKARRDRHYPDSPWVFSRHGERIRTFKNAWEAAAVRAAKRCPSLWDQDRKKARRLFHDLRRTGVRNLVRAGVPERVAMAISGHKTRAVFDRYNIVSQRDLRDAAAKLEHYFESQSGTKRGTNAEIAETDSERVEPKSLN